MRPSLLLLIILTLSAVVPPLGFSQESRSMFEKGDWRDGVRSGVWEYADVAGTVALRYDYSKNKVLKIHHDTTSFLILKDGEWKGQQLDVSPRYLGSYQVLYNKIESDLRYPDGALRKGRESTVWMFFEVDVDGMAKNPRLYGDPGDGFGEEVVRAFSQHQPNQWIPAEIEGVVYKSIITIPFVFCINTCPVDTLQVPYKVLPSMQKVISNKTEFEQTAAQRRAFGTSQKVNPLWSPDGTKILFEEISSQTPRLYITEIAENFGVTPISHEVGMEFDGQWCGDSNHIIYNYMLGMRVAEIKVKDLVTGQIQQLSNDNELNPTPSKDGEKVLSNSFNRARSATKLLMPRRNEIKDVTTIKGNVSNFYWSPDNTKICYQTTKQDEPPDLIVIDSSFTVTKPLPIIGSEFCDWFPDNRRVIVKRPKGSFANFSSARGYYRYIGGPQRYVQGMQYTSSKVTGINMEYDLFIVDTQTLDFKKIGAFTNIDDIKISSKGFILVEQRGTLHVMQEDGAKKKILSNATDADWHPDGNKFVFVSQKDNEIYFSDIYGSVVIVTGH